MKRLEELKRLQRDASTKILLYVIDGVGGLPHPSHGQTELERASIPFLDSLAARSACGRTVPYGTGIAPGSGPGHLALFGYPNDQIQLSRGVLEVLGASTCLRHGEPESTFQLSGADLTARGNFAWVEGGTLVVVDRRGGAPISDQQNREIVGRLSREIRIEGVDIFLFPGRGHRFAVAFRGADLRGPLTDSDPQQTGLKVATVLPGAGASRRSVEVVNEFMTKAHAVLGVENQPNFSLLRGIGCAPSIPGLTDLYGIRAVCLATYPMYRGVSRLVGMDVLEVKTRDEQVATLNSRFGDYDLFFVHIKETDALGHKGDFDGKVAELEKVDRHLKSILELPFDVVVVTGDHSTPTVLSDHSYHPVPTMVWSKHCLNGNAQAYHERAVANGMLGTIRARDLMTVALAEAGRFNKYGA